MRHTDNDKTPFTVGAPYDPFGNESENRHPTARIVPFQFDYPTYPLGFSLIKDTEMPRRETEDFPGEAK